MGPGINTNIFLFLQPNALQPSNYVIVQQLIKFYSQSFTYEVLCLFYLISSGLIRTKFYSQIFMLILSY